MPSSDLSTCFLAYVSIFLLVFKIMKKLDAYKIYLGLMFSIPCSSA